MHLKVAVVAGAKRGTARPAGGQGRVEGAKIRAQNLGAAQHRVEIRPDDLLAAGPFPQAAVAPDDRVVGVQQHDAVGHALQNAFVLQQLADLNGVGQMLRSDVDPDEAFAPRRLRARIELCDSTTSYCSRS